MISIILGTDVWWFESTLPDEFVSYPHKVWYNKFMAIYVCGTCNKEFKSKHRTAKYCSTRCSGLSMASEYSRRYRVYSDEELLDHLRLVAKTIQKTPSHRYMSSINGPDPATYRARWGSWNNAVIAAGLKTNDVRITDTNIGTRKRFAVLQRDSFTCVYCGRSPKDGVVLEVDHIVAKCNGGTNDMTNLATACRDCNMGKSGG